MTFEQMLIVGLAFLGTMMLGGAVLNIQRSRQERLRSRLSQLRRDGATVAGSSMLVEAVTRIGHKVSSGRASRGLREQLAQSGYHGESSASVYLGSKIMLMMIGAIGAGVAVSLSPWEIPSSFKLVACAITGGMLFFIPNAVVTTRRQKRRREVRSSLPDAVDLLEVCVSSGMALDMAWNLVSEEIRDVSPVLADEMALANLEIHLGAPRAEALRHLAARTGAEEVGSLVAVLVQSDRFGTSVSDALRAFSSSMREGRSARAEEEAERMSVRMLFPMVLFIFPAVLVVLVGPAGIVLYKAMFN